MVKIVRKKVLNPSVTLLEVEAPLIAKKARAGQFIILRLDEQGERIPLTIADYDREKGTITIIFQKVGLTTELLADLNEGDSIKDFVGPLGLPTELPEGARRVCVVGGGVGCAIAYPQAKTCHAEGLEVDVIAVAAGPGSFTGLRIGVATAKGLSWGADKDCVACSTLESMAWPLAFYEDAVIVCAMDARRKQVYNALFQTGGEKLERLTPDRAISLEELGEELKKIQKRKIVVGDGAKLCYNTLREAGLQLELAPEPLRMQSAWGVARAAVELAQAGKLVKGQDLVPVYHRLSQAERERLERERQGR